MLLRTSDLRYFCRFLAGSLEVQGPQSGVLSVQCESIRPEIENSEIVPHESVSHYVFIGATDIPKEAQVANWLCGLIKSGLQVA